VQASSRGRTSNFGPIERCSILIERPARLVATRAVGDGGADCCDALALTLLLGLLLGLFLLARLAASPTARWSQVVAASLTISAGDESEGGSEDARAGLGGNDA
jgi:hypothetical protein